MSRLYRSARRPRRALTTQDVELAFAMYMEGGLTVREIASEMRVTPNTLGIYLREWRAALGGMEHLRSLDPPRLASRVTIEPGGDEHG